MTYKQRAARNRTTFKHRRPSLRLEYQPQSLRWISPSAALLEPLTLTTRHRTVFSTKPPQRLTFVTHSAPRIERADMQAQEQDAKAGADFRQGRSCVSPQSLPRSVIQSEKMKAPRQTQVWDKGPQKPAAGCLSRWMRPHGLDASSALMPAARGMRLSNNSDVIH